MATVAALTSEPKDLGAKMVLRDVIDRGEVARGGCAGGRDWALRGVNKSE